LPSSQGHGNVEQPERRGIGRHISLKSPIECRGRTAKQVLPQISRRAHAGFAAFPWPRPGLRFD
jgi:hypothetical protein